MQVATVMPVTRRSPTERTKWIATIELPNGVVFDQYVFRVPRCVMAAVVDETGENILLAHDTRNPMPEMSESRKVFKNRNPRR